jgi:hypothetical protein
MRIFVLTATYELRVSKKATYVTTLLKTLSKSRPMTYIHYSLADISRLPWHRRNEEWALKKNDQMTEKWIIMKEASVRFSELVTDILEAAKTLLCWKKPVKNFKKINCVFKSTLYSTLLHLPPSDSTLSEDFGIGPRTVAKLKFVSRDTGLSNAY